MCIRDSFLAAPINAFAAGFNTLLTGCTLGFPPSPLYLNLLILFNFLASNAFLPASVSTSLPNCLKVLYLEPFDKLSKVSPVTLGFFGISPLNTPSSPGGGVLPPPVVTIEPPPPPGGLPPPGGGSNKLPCLYLEEPPPDGGFCLGVFLP